MRANSTENIKTSWPKVYNLILLWTLDGGLTGGAGLEGLAGAWGAGLDGVCPGVCVLGGGAGLTGGLLGLAGAALPGFEGRGGIALGGACPLQLIATASNNVRLIKFFILTVP